VLVRSLNVFGGENAIDHRANHAARDQRQDMSDEPTRGFRLFLDRTRPQHRAGNGEAFPQKEAEIDFGFPASR